MQDRVGRFGGEGLSLCYWSLSLQERLKIFEGNYFGSGGGGSPTFHLNIFTQNKMNPKSKWGSSIWTCLVLCMRKGRSTYTMSRTNQVVRALHARINSNPFSRLVASNASTSPQLFRAQNLCAAHEWLNVGRAPKVNERLHVSPPFWPNLDLRRTQRLDMQICDGGIMATQQCRGHNARNGG